MFKVVNYEHTGGAIVALVSILDTADNVEEKLSLEVVSGYIDMGVTIEGLTKSNETIAIKYEDKEKGAVEYTYKSTKDGYELISPKVESVEISTVDDIVNNEFSTTVKEPTSVVEESKPIIDELVSPVKEPATKCNAKQDKKKEESAKAKVGNKPKKKAEPKLNALQRAEIRKSNLVLQIKDLSTGEKEEFDFSSNTCKSKLLNGVVPTLTACSDDFLYFVGDDIKISLPSTVVSNFSLKDTLLLAIDTVVSVADTSGCKVSLLAKCLGKSDCLIQVFTPFSKELGVTGQRYEVSFVYR